MNAPNLQTIKNKTDILEVAARYCDLKKVNDNTYKAVVNPIRDEKTSSLHFYIDSQKYHDFGSNESGDVLDLISKVENISLSDAINRLGDQTLTARPIKERPQPVQSVEISSEQLLKEFDAFQRVDYSKFEHRVEVLSTVELFLLRGAAKEDLELFYDCIRYDSMNKTLVAGWYKHSIRGNKIVTYKRRRLNGAKWVNRKDTHPNQTIMNRITKANQPIYVVEGARDALTAILTGINFIAIPTTSFKDAAAIKHILTPDDEVVFVCEDAQGYKAMSKLSEQIPNSKLLTFATSKEEKIDLSDFARIKCTSLQEMLNELK